MKVLSGLLLSSLLLFACSEKPPAKTVFDSQVDGMNKARAVDAKVQADAEHLRQTIDAATNPPAGP